MEILTKNTTKEHYEKFRVMAEEAGITFKRTPKPLGYSVEELRKLYIEDNNLNNIPLIELDSFYLCLPSYTRKIITNMADNCCVYKHLLIYEVLGVVPVFVDTPLNLRD